MVNIRYWNGSLVFHELSFSVHSLGSTVSHDAVVVVKNRVDGKGPGVQPRYPKHVLEGDGFFVGLVHGVGGLFLESVNGSMPVMSP